MTGWDFDTHRARMRRQRRLGYTILAIAALGFITGAGIIFYWAFA